MLGLPFAKVIYLVALGLSSFVGSQLLWVLFSNLWRGGGFLCFLYYFGMNPCQRKSGEGKRK